MNLDENVCYCFRITRRKIVNYLKRERPRRASQISDCFGAGSACGWCIPYLVRMHEEIVGEEAVESGDISGEDYEQLRKKYLKDLKEGLREKNLMEGRAPTNDPDDDLEL